MDLPITASHVGGRKLPAHVKDNTPHLFNYGVLLPARPESTGRLATDPDTSEGYGRSLLALSLLGFDNREIVEVMKRLMDASLSLSALSAYSPLTSAMAQNSRATCID